MRLKEIAFMRRLGYQSEMVDERFIITKEDFMNIIENAQEEHQFGR